MRDKSLSKVSPVETSIKGDLSISEDIQGQGKDSIPPERMSRILNRSSRDWGGEFIKVLTDSSVRQPLGVVFSAPCTRLGKSTVSNAFSKSKSLPPSILLATINQNGTASIVYCQSYRHFLATVLTSSLASPNATKATLALTLPLLQMLPQGCSLTLFTDEAEAEDKDLAYQQVLTMALHKSCKVNIFWCQGKSGTVLSDELKPWELLAEKTKGQFIRMDESPPPVPVEVTLQELKGLTGASRIPIRVDPSMLQLHVQISGTIQRAILSNDDNGNIDLFALQSQEFPPAVPSPHSIAPLGPLPAYSGTGSLAAGQNPSPQDSSDARELDVYVSVGHGSWVLNTRGVKYDVQLRGVVSPRPSVDDLMLPSSSLIDLAVNTSGPEPEGGSHKIEARSDTEVRPEYRQGAPGPGGGNDRNGFLWSDMHLLGGPFYDRPRVPLGADYNGALGSSGQFIMGPTLEVNQASSLTALPGETVHIVFDLVNNFQRPVKFFFTARDQFQYVRNVHPTIRWVDPYESVRVTVWLEAQGSEGTTDVVSLTAVGLEPITRNVYLHIGREMYDNSKPDISYSWKGDCENALTPETCARASWGIEAVVQDTESGLLKVVSKPFPLRFRSNFVAGTRDQVKVQYISSCCFLKVDLMAYDVKGNVNKYTINVENRWLSWSQILAIVFGSILLIIVLVLIVYAVARCIQVRRQRNFLRE